MASLLSSPLLCSALHVRDQIPARCSGTNLIHSLVARPATFYIYTSELAIHSSSISSTGTRLVGVVLVVAWQVSVTSGRTRESFGRTQVEVVVLCIAKGNQETNDVNERCGWSVWKLLGSLFEASTHVVLTGSCPCTSSGSDLGDPWPRAREPGHGAASRRSSPLFACGQHWGRSRWPAAASAGVPRLRQSFRRASHRGGPVPGAWGAWGAYVGRGNLRRLSVGSAETARRCTGRTLGGMRVERPRVCMKLMVTAGAGLASIGLGGLACRA